MSRPADEPDEPEELAIPPGHVPLTPGVRPALKRPEPLSLWWKLGGLAVVLAATAGTIVYLSQPADPRGSPRGTAEVVAQSISGSDVHAFRSYLCHADELTPDTIRENVTNTALQAGKLTVLEVSDETLHATNSLASATLTSSRRPDVDIVLLLRKQEDSWCLASLSYCPLANDTTSDWLTPDLSGCRTRPGRGR
ncbi:hypothetical protein [Actinophytocola sp.]|uniref:hypothetical protein n=1 Tax=Actinophytocola sp. TaxID=1872138 RepID=UPI002D3906BA|nr:hypothetical protein [Actinophytocola sp.]HYQ65368.1 hypothetical protein [Actinophytocola sp.]